MPNNHINPLVLYAEIEKELAALPLSQLNVLAISHGLQRDTLNVYEIIHKLAVKFVNQLDDYASEDSNTTSRRNEDEDDEDDEDEDDGDSRSGSEY